MTTGARLAERVTELLGTRSIATAESCTAGRLAESLAAVPGAVESFRGGLIAYQTRCKRELLGVTASSVVSEQAAAEMAEGAARLFGADVAVSATGVAGAESVDGEPPGTVYIAVAIDGDVTSAHHRFDGSSEEILDAARRAAFEMLIELLGGQPGGQAAGGRG